MSSTGFDLIIQKLEELDTLNDDIFEINKRGNPVYNNIDLSTIKVRGNVAHAIISLNRFFADTNPGANFIKDILDEYDYEEADVNDICETIVDDIANNNSSFSLRKSSLILIGTTKTAKTKRHVRTKLPEAIYVDSAQNNSTNGTAWCSITDELGNDLVEHYKDLFPDCTLREEKLPVGIRTIAIVTCDTINKMKNNAGEVQAMAMGLRIALSTGIKKLYTDSDLVFKYWSKGIIAPATKAKMDKQKLAYIMEAVNKRKELEADGGAVLWISGDCNPSDLGYHK